MHHHHYYRPLRFSFAVVFAILLSVILITPFISSPSAQAQPTPPAGGPTSPQGQFYTLQHIFDRLDSGTTDDKPTTFTGPPSGSIDSTMPSINDIMAILPAVDDTDCASPSDVLEDKTYFSLCSSDWGEQTGTTPQPVLTPELLATGQNTCYNASGSVISCSGTGQDGEYQLGATESPRFTDNEDGTVTDNLTGLIWLQNANCFGTRTWQNALNDANGLASGSCGLTDGSVAGDWRLPNRRELLSLVDYQHSNPSLPSGHPFSSVVSSSYWSSTTRVNIPTSAGRVFFGTSSANFATKTLDFYVWPVR